MATPKVITRAEAAKHNTDKDCYFVIEGKVYDITPFLDEVRCPPALF